MTITDDTFTYGLQRDVAVNDLITSSPTPHKLSATATSSADARGVFLGYDGREIMVSRAELAALIEALSAAAADLDRIAT